MRTIIEHIVSEYYRESFDVDDEFVDGRITLAIDNDSQISSIDLARDELIKLRDALTELIDKDDAKE